MKTIVPSELPVSNLFGLLLGAIGPRPIAFASTIDASGNHNLAPFSFFNIFGANPPTLIFSPSRRGRDNTTKHTLDNVKEVAEVVINIVNYAMVQQVSLASNEFPKGVNEFVKAGFTSLESDLVKPLRVAESPVQLECLVKQIIETGTEGGAGNLVICEIIKVHISEAILNENGAIDPHKIDLVGRMGGDLYCRASGAAVFEVKKPGFVAGIGIDALPTSVRNSNVLSGNDLGQLGNLKQMPTAQELSVVKTEKEIAEFLQQKGSETRLHSLAKKLIEQGELTKALCILLM